MSDHFSRRPADIGDQLSQWMAIDAGAAPTELVDDVMDAVIRLRRARPRRPPVLGAVLRYGALAAAIAGGIALGVLLSTAWLHSEQRIGATPVPDPTVLDDASGGVLPGGPLRADESISASGTAPSVGPSGVWYATTDGSGIGLLPDGSGDPVVLELWSTGQSGDASRVRTIVEAFGSVWVADGLAGELLKVNLATREIDQRTALGSGRVTAGRESLWYVTESALVRVDPEASRITAEVLGAGGPDAAIVAYGGSVWVATGTELLRVDETTATLVDRMAYPVKRLTAGGGAIWAATDSEIVRVDVATSAVSRRAFGALGTPIDRVVDLAWAGDRQLLVISDRGNEDVIQIAFPSWTVLERTSFARQNEGIAIGFGAVWVATSPDGRIWRMVPEP